MGSPNTSLSGRTLHSVIKPERQVTQSADKASVLYTSSLVLGLYTVPKNTHTHTYRPQSVAATPLTARENGLNPAKAARVFNPSRCLDLHV